MASGRLGHRVGISGVQEGGLGMRWEWDEGWWPAEVVGGQGVYLLERGRLEVLGGLGQVLGPGGFGDGVGVGEGSVMVNSRIPDPLTIGKSGIRRAGVGLKGTWGG